MKDEPRENIKCDLSFFLLQSYWDWLPLEIQEYILQLTSAQYLRDCKALHQNVWTLVCDEILVYAELKRLWGNHIRFMIEPGHLKGGGDQNITDSTGAQKHLVIMGRPIIMLPGDDPYRFISYGLKDAYRGIERSRDR